VGAVARRLDDDVARKAEMIAQGKQLRLARVARRVLALGRIRKLGAWPEHVAMRVDAAERKRKSRLARRLEPVEPALGLLERPSDGLCGGVYGGSPSVDVPEAGLVERLAHLIHVETERAGGELGALVTLVGLARGGGGGCLSRPFGRDDDDPVVVGDNRVARIHRRAGADDRN